MGNKDSDQARQWLRLSLVVSREGQPKITENWLISLAWSARLTETWDLCGITSSLHCIIKVDKLAYLR